MSMSVALLLAVLYGDIPNAKHAWAVHDLNRPKPAKVEVSAKGVPSDAVVLFDGTAASFRANWCDAQGRPSQWKLGTEGDFYCVPGWKNGGNIYTRQHFGDCQLHVEFRHEADINVVGEPQMRGNSGVFLMGTDYGYEVQVLESYYTSREKTGCPDYVDNYADGQAGAIYAESPPLVNPQRRPGEWQVYDIVFHQPVWDGLRLVHPGSITVFFNGVLVQDHWEPEGQTTHRHRRPLAPHPTTGPLALQDHGCPVHFRNIWYRPISSRWANTVSCAMSANENDVMALRRKTAAELFAKIADPKAATAENVKALGEVVSYANEGEYKRAFRAALKAYADREHPADEKKSLNKSLGALVRGGVITHDLLPQ